MSYTPRDYQADGIDQVRESIMRVGACCFVCPTGSGKTVTAAFMCASAVEKGTPTVVLVHRQELLDQTVEHVGEGDPRPPDRHICCRIPIPTRPAHHSGHGTNRRRPPRTARQC